MEILSKVTKSDIYAILHPFWAQIWNKLWIFSIVIMFQTCSIEKETHTCQFDLFLVWLGLYKYRTYGKFGVLTGLRPTMILTCVSMQKHLKTQLICTLLCCGWTKTRGIPAKHHTSPFKKWYLNHTVTSSFSRSGPGHVTPPISAQHGCHVLIQSSKQTTIFTLWSFLKNMTYG